MVKESDYGFTHTLVVKNKDGDMKYPIKESLAKVLNRAKNIKIEYTENSNTLLHVSPVAI